MKKEKIISPNQILCGDSSVVLTTLPLKSVQCVITSPPYWGLRDYGTATWKGGDPSCKHKQKTARNDGGRVQVQGFHGSASPDSNKGDMNYKEVCPKCGAKRTDIQIGLEKTPEEYVTRLVALFREVKRVLRDDGTLWLNLGDSYTGGGNNTGNTKELSHKQSSNRGNRFEKKNVPAGTKPKDLIGIPWLVALALRADGWYLRSDIIWAKNNPMPESVTDRPTRSHEYIFLLTKSKKYYYDNEAIKEPLAASSVQRLTQPTFDSQMGGEKDYGPTSNRSARKTLVNLKKHYCGPNSRANVDHVPKKTLTQDLIAKGTYVGFNDRSVPVTKRNKRDVWTIAVKPYMGAHFATFPEKLVEPCILAGSKPGDVVMDPFAGSGTTLAVALRLGRHYLGIEGNPKYMKLIRERIKKVLDEKD